MGDSEDASEYWRAADDSFVADDAYYQRTKSALVDVVLPLLRPTATVLDIGCGDGTYTEHLAAAAGSVTTYDLSPQLVDRARKRGIPNATFAIGDVTDRSPARFDLVSCMGVLVCIIDDTQFASSLAAVSANVRPGGHLVLRESFNGWGARTDRGAYTARYRTRRHYHDVLEPLGFETAHDVHLATWSWIKRRTNHLWVLTRRN